MKVSTAALSSHVYESVHLPLQAPRKRLGRKPELKSGVKQVGFVRGGCSAHARFDIMYTHALIADGCSLIHGLDRTNQLKYKC